MQLNNISDSTIKAFFALLMVSALIVGFFMKLISAEIFTGFFGIVITHYFKNEETKKLREQVKEKDEQIMSMSVPSPAIEAQRVLING